MGAVSVIMLPSINGERVIVMKKIIVMIVVVMLLLVGCESTHEIVFVEGKDVVIDEQRYVGLFYDFTNNSGETAIPADVFDVKAFQNGVELVITVFTGDKTDGAVQCDTSIQTGTTARGVWLFEKVDDSPVSVEMSDGQRFVVGDEK